MKLTEISKQYREHGVPLLRVFLAVPQVPTQESIHRFYEELSERLLSYAAKTAEARAKKLSSLPRAERATFYELALRFTVELTYEDERYLSFRSDFCVSDRKTIHRFLRLGQTFRCADGTLCEPKTLAKEKIPKKYTEAYLTEKGLVAVCNFHGALERRLSPTDSRRKEIFFEEVILSVNSPKKENSLENDIGIIVQKFERHAGKNQ